VSEKSDVICVQETKLSSVSNLLLKKIMRVLLNSRACILANRTAGGVILAWKSSLFTELSRQIKSYVVTVDLQSKLDNSVMRVSGVYGPSTPTNRSTFFAELINSKPTQDTPWLVCGDFNQTVNNSDISRQSRQQDVIFQQLVQTLGLIDLRLHGRQFTWSNEREMPTFARLDRFLISNSWSQLFPNCLQTALPINVSDHSLIACTCSTTFPLPNTFRFEIFWLKLPEFKDLVHASWDRTTLVENPYMLQQKMIKLRKSIRQWKKNRVGNLTYQKKVRKEMLIWLDQKSERRQLITLELLTKGLVRDRLQRIVQMEEHMWKQRAKRTWVKQGDKNTAFFHATASVQKRANWISTIKDDSQQYNAHNDKAASLHRYFCSLLGTSNGMNADFQFEKLYENKLNQEEWQRLQRTIEQEEIESALNNWSSNESPGPDGFTGEFFKYFKEILMPDLMRVFNNDIASPQLTWYPLNDSYIALIPKTEMACKPSDFRPINLINGIQKIFSKILACRLQPFMGKLLTETQTGFLKGRSILHGFHYAREDIGAAVKQNQQMVVFKVDIHKAFDSI
jgi:exonuclease III